MNSANRLWCWIPALACLFVAASAIAERVNIPAPHIEGKDGLRAQLFLPEPKKSEPRRPAAILLHGCGGVGAKGELNARHAMWKDWLIERGFIVLFPESFTSRGVDQLCTQRFRDRTIQQRHRVDDVRAAQKWLAARGDVDASKLVLWGWSHGGGTVLDTIRSRSDSTPAFAHAIAFYPGCSNALNDASPRALAAPLSLFIGEADDWTPAKPCIAWVKELQEKTLPATITTFANAYHDFDSPTGKVRVRKDVPNGVNGADTGVTVGPNPEAREAAKAQIEATLRKAKLIVD